MYKTLSNRLTSFFLNKNLISEDQAPIYSYGFEIILSTLMYVSIFIITALLTSTLVSSLIFFLGFFFVRRFCGGFHASTYLKCHLITAMTHFAAIATMLLFPNSLQQLFSNISLISSSVLIMLFAPVDHKNKPFVKNEYNHFKKRSRIYACVIILITITNTALFTYIDTQPFIFSYSLGTLTATLSMLVAKIKKSYERR